jgi:hypothetical protein
VELAHPASLGEFDEYVVVAGEANSGSLSMMNSNSTRSPSESVAANPLNVGWVVVDL